MRGDVPDSELLISAGGAFSPHAWGCTALDILHTAGVVVFPTCVGMYRSTTGGIRPLERFPHMRGDVPDRIAWTGSQAAFSPHAWGCTGKPGAD